jgi:hypothetical protein
MPAARAIMYVDAAVQVESVSDAVSCKPAVGIQQLHAVLSGKLVQFTGAVVWLVSCKQLCMWATRTQASGS